MRLTLAGDFRKAAGDWQPEKPDPRLGRWIGDGSEPQFELILDCMADPYDPNGIEPLPMIDFVVEPTKFHRGAVQVYRLTLKNEHATLVDRHIVIPPDAEEVDLCACPDATDEEIREALNFEPAPPPPKPAPKPVEYRRISREEDPSSSRLGFTCGGTEERPIGVGNRWTIHGFHLGSPQIIGALAVSLGVSAFNSQRLEVALFDAMGECVLRLNMRESRVRFDQRKLSSCDYLIAWRSPGPGVEGTGSYRAPHARLLADELPERPILDELILSDAPDASLGECGVPAFKFSAQ